MTVNIFLSTLLRPYVEGYDAFNGISLEPAEGETVRSACARLGIPVDKIRMVMINGRKVSQSHPLTHGDRMGLFPPLGGG